MGYNAQPATLVLNTLCMYDRINHTREVGLTDIIQGRIRSWVGLVHCPLAPVCWTLATGACKAENAAATMTTLTWSLGEFWYDIVARYHFHGAVSLPARLVAPSRRCGTNHRQLLSLEEPEIVGQAPRRIVVGRLSDHLRARRPSGCWWDASSSRRHCVTS